MQVRTLALLGRCPDQVCLGIIPTSTQIQGPLEVRANQLLTIRYLGIVNLLLPLSGSMFNFPKPAASGGSLFGPGPASSTGTSGSGAAGITGTMNAASGAGPPSATGSTTPAATGMTTGSNTLGGGLFGNTKPADSTAKPATSSCEYRVMMKSGPTLMNRSLHPSYDSDGFLYRRRPSR